MLRRPRLISPVAGRSISPVLVGDFYAINEGRWGAARSLRLWTEWLDGEGHRLAQGIVFRLTAAQLGEVVAARICASVRVAATCIVLRLPEQVRSVADYLQLSCGSRRPAPPPYDPGFVMLSSPAVGHGWNPCRTDVWAIDTYGEPPLLDSSGASWEALISSALAQASSATGIVFQRAPDYATVPAAMDLHPPGVSLTIDFGPTPPGVAGLGGPVVSGTFAIGGAARLDTQKAWKIPEAQTVLLHEIGHALGLGHPLPPPAPLPQNEIMDSGNYGFTSYQPGDLCGLFEVTWQRPCAGAALVTPGQGAEGGPGVGPASDASVRAFDEIAGTTPSSR